MSTSLDHLLPAPDAFVRCADYSVAIGVDPGGTAIRADRIVVVAVPLPWPKPALAHPLLAGFVEAMADAARPTRVLTAVPGDGVDGPPAGTVTVFDRTGGTASRSRHGFDGEADLAQLGELLAAADDRALPPFDPMIRPAVLVCTQGSHDVCCGSDGVRFADEVAQSMADDIDLYRVSHTGGHRFAPTALTLPDGRMWADLDLDALRVIVNRLGDAADMADRCRGWWGAATGPAQVAERAVLAEVGWSLDEVDRVVEGAEGPDGDTMYTVAAGEARWEVEVATGRQVPTIACRQPGGLPAKPGQEYDVVSMTAHGP